MSSPDKESGISFAEGTSRHLSPPPAGLRQRPLGRASTFAEPSLNRRRSSIFSSDTISEARKSIRSSTDDLFLPRANATNDVHEHDENSHWHSLPLGLALLPAAGGLFFKDGSAIITDVTLLIIAAVFMNWALRMPWEWYYSAQSSTPTRPDSPTIVTPAEIDENDLTAKDSSPDPLDTTQHSEPLMNNRTAAETELRLHELAALCSCFLCPGLAAWLLHAIRSQLSRPSEGLVSNYNLTIFLLVAEIRPMSHLIKMIQRRTLFLQRKANLDALHDNSHPPSQQLNDVLARVEELEAHIANDIATSQSSQPPPLPPDSADQIATKASQLALSDLRKTVHPEMEALARAMRRYEKKSTITAVQIEARLQELEARCVDVLSIAAAAQRSADSQSRQYYWVVVNWVCAAVVVPVEMGSWVAGLPGRLYKWLIGVVAGLVPGKRPRRVKEGKGVGVRRSGAAKLGGGEREKKGKTSS